MGLDTETWGNAAEWAGAVGSVGAIGAALLLLQHERRERKEANAERRTGAARFITLDVRSHAEGAEFNPETGEVGPPWNLRATAVLANSGIEPIRVSLVRVVLNGVTSREDRTLGVVLPGTQREVPGVLNRVADHTHEARAEAWFEDVHGQRWRLPSGEFAQRIDESTVHGWWSALRGSLSRVGAMIGRRGGVGDRA